MTNEYSLFMMKNSLYSNKQIYEITGETKQRIQYWILKRVFQPADSGGSVGAARRYSFSNLIEIKIAQILSPVLNNVDFITTILDQIRTDYPSFFEVSINEEESDMSILTIMIQSDKAIISYLHDSEKLKECLDNNLTMGVKFFVMYLGDLKAELIKKIEAL